MYSESAPEDGRNCRPKHVEQNLKESIRNVILLHLVSCGYHWVKFYMKHTRWCSKYNIYKYAQSQHTHFK